MKNPINVSDAVHVAGAELNRLLREYIPDSTKRGTVNSALFDYVEALIASMPTIEAPIINPNGENI